MTTHGQQTLGGLDHLVDKLSSIPHHAVHAGARLDLPIQIHVKKGRRLLDLVVLAKITIGLVLRWCLAKAAEKTQRINRDGVVLARLVANLDESRKHHRP